MCAYVECYPRMQPTRCRLSVARLCRTMKLAALTGFVWKQCPRGYPPNGEDRSLSTEFPKVRNRYFAREQFQPGQPTHSANDALPAEVGPSLLLRTHPARQNMSSVISVTSVTINSTDCLITVSSNREF